MRNTISMNSVKHSMLHAELSTTISSAEQTAQSIKRNGRHLCFGFSKFLMTVTSGSVPRRSVSFYQIVVSMLERNGFGKSCKNSVLKVFVRMPRMPIKSARNTSDAI